MALNILLLNRRIILELSELNNLIKQKLTKSISIKSLNENINFINIAITYKKIVPAGLFIFLFFQDFAQNFFKSGLSLLDTFSMPNP
jgi:hypothetical protein